MQMWQETNVFFYNATTANCVIRGNIVEKERKKGVGVIMGENFTEEKKIRVVLADRDGFYLQR